MKTYPKWDELRCPECGATNVVIVDFKLQIPGRCKSCGKDVVFQYRSNAFPRGMWKAIEKGKGSL